jgi:hypothetical protein
MKSSIFEQIALILIALVVTMVESSSLFATWLSDASFVADVILVAVFVYALLILYDTANAVFMLISHLRKNTNS